MHLKRINEKISEFGKITRIEKNKFSFFDFKTNEEIFFKFDKTFSVLDSLLSSGKHPLEVISNPLHFNLIKEKKEKLGFELNNSKDKIIRLFEAVGDFIDLIALKRSKACVVSGMSQIGKTTFVLKKLQEAKEKYSITSEIALLRGASSPMALYDFLYANKDKIIVIDDCDSVFETEKGLNVLKAVLDPSEERRVYWLSGEAAVPEFVFEGQIIFITNYSFFKMKKNKNYKHLIAVINRADYIEIDGNSEQVLEYIKHIENSLYPNKDIRKFVLKYLEEKVKKHSIIITPQIFKDLCRIKEFKEQKFETLAEIKLINTLLNEI